MAATEPGQVIHEFCALFNAGDVDALVDACYEDGAMINPTPADAPLVGKPAITEALKGFVGLGGTLRIVATKTVANGDIALTQSRWRLDIPAGDPMENVSAEIVRRQPDGTWKYVVDNPWGGLIVDA